MHGAAMPDNAPNLADAERFLRLLDPTTDRFEFRTFDDNKERKDEHLTRTFYGTLAQHAAALQRLNDKGAGAFVVINETDGKGRENKDIKRVRAPHIDLDGGTPLEPVRAAKLRPHIIVSSSPGKWHVYWLVTGMALENFTPVQERLIEVFGSDPKVKGLAGVMRLPGFYHRKAEPFLVRIIETHDTPPYPAAYFKLADRPKRKAVGDDIEVNPDKAIAAFDAMPNDNVDEDMWYRLLASGYVAGGGSKDVRDAARRWSNKSIKHKDRRFWERWRAFDRKPPTEIGPGTLFRYADETAPGWREAMVGDAMATLAKQYAADIAAAKAKGGSHAL
jgi:hypothetical protein